MEMNNLQQPDASDKAALMPQSPARWQHKPAKRCETGGCGLCLLTAPCPMTAFSCISVPQQTEKLIFRFGEYEGTMVEPGLYWSNCCGRSDRTVSTARQTLELPRGSKNLIVLDARGNPLVVSGCIVYNVVDSYKAVVQTENYRSFIETQGEAAIKAVIGKYPYESSGAGEPCLQRGGETVNSALKAELQKELEFAGIEVHSFVVKEISYAPVIAAAMLKRQQAQAMVEARKTIVEGAVAMSVDANEQLKSAGIQLDQKESARLVSNLLTVICSEGGVAPTLPLQGE